MKPLRFAPFIRVSTEKQAEQGRSLQDQKSAIIGYVKALGGTIPESLWGYVGQESATPETEKRMFNRLLQDAEKRAFDCVIVQHADRLSRDNEQLKRALRIFRSANIRFFVQTTEKDLYNPQDCFELGLTAEFSEYVALQYAKKSISARIANAKEQAAMGLAPENLRLPFARFRQPDGTWGLDQEKAALVRVAIDLYLDAENGKGVEGIAQVVGINYMTLNRVFRHGLGDGWQREFTSHKFNIHEVVEYKIPAIVENPGKIKAVLEKMKRNKTFTHANRKRSYLLSKFVMCKECGSALSGNAPHGKRAYSHLDKRRSECSCASNPIARIDAHLLEGVVEAELENLFTSKAIETQIKEYCANPALQEKSQTLALLEGERRQLQTETQRLAAAYAKGVFTDSEVQPLIQANRTRANSLDTEIEKLRQAIANAPSEEALKRRSQLVRKAARALLRRKVREDADNHFKNTRKLVESVFEGRDAEGRRLGVYLWKEDGKWFYELRGNLPWVSTTGELYSDQTARLLGLDNDDDTPPSGGGGGGQSGSSPRGLTAQPAYIPMC